MELVTENKELTPELKAEMLGETTPTAEPPAAEVPASGTEPLKTGEPTTTPGEAPKVAETPAPGEVKPPEPTVTPSEQIFKQADVERIVQERVANLSRENQQLKERLETPAPRPQPQQPTQPTDPADLDLGKVFRDPEWNGWSLRKLKEQGYDEQFQTAVARLEAVKQFNILRQDENKQRQEQFYQDKVSQETEEVRKIAPDMFDAATGKPNQKFIELTDWAANNGIFNAPLAFKLRNMDALIAQAKKDAVTEYLNGLNKPVVRRAGDGGTTPVVTTNLKSLDDTALQQAFITSVSGSPQRKTILAEMEARGL